MCDFISWIEVGEDILFLTGKDVFETKRGRELQVYCQSSVDLVGHGAIRRYYGITGGTKRECTDFSSPDNFPAQIVKAIKAGEFRGLGKDLKLLTPSALTEYEKVGQPTWAEYDKVRQSVWAEYQRAKQYALTEYEKVEQSARAEYEKVQYALAKYNKAGQSASAKYNKAGQSASAKYDRAEQKVFWDLFANPKNRIKAWR